MKSPNRRNDRTSLYKYVDLAAAKAILGGRVLRWSSPIKFNDPFDIPRAAILGFTVEDLIRTSQAAFLEILKSDRMPGSPMFALLKSETRRLGLQPEQVIPLMYAASGVARAKIERGLAEFTSLWADVVPRLRVLCMSEVSDGPNMWAHYADDHRGAVLEFRVSDELDSSWLLAQRVVYRREPPVLPGVGYWANLLLNNLPIDWLEFFKEYFYTKTPEWASEKEWRTISLAPEGVTALYEDRGFHPNELASVRLGAEMPGADREAIAALVRGRYPDAVLWRAVADQGARSIAFQRY